MNYPLEGLILAGGNSSRMGRDKALLEIGGVSLICRVYQVAEQCSDRVYVVTPWVDRYRSVLPSACQFVQERVAPETPGSHGPLVGFAQGLEQTRADWVLLLACDLPYLEASVLKAWSQELEAVPDDAIALLPRHPKGWEPLCGFYRRRCLPHLNAWIEAGGRSFQTWLATQTIQALPLPDTSMLLNCNTPDDLETATRVGQGDRSTGNQD